MLSSPVWKFFELSKDNKKEAKCLPYKDVISRQNNTTNLWRHLEDKHMIEHTSLI